MANATDAAGQPTPRPRISVKFSAVGRVQRFLLPELAPEGDGAQPPPPVAPGDTVVVRTLDGPAIGRVIRTSAAAVEQRNDTMPEPQHVMRRATASDVAIRFKQEQRERDGYRVCSLKIRERGLQMKLSRVEHAFDGSRLIFYFTADGRIDFRELVRDLAAEFRMRIEMRQIGVRDEARMLGGYGSCGRPLCCTTWLQSFEPVSIKMAKQQNLSLNPSKLSGLCGRLKCCLRYELPNGKGEQFAGCAQQGSCGGSGCSGDGQCGSGGGCGACGR